MYEEEDVVFDKPTFGSVELANYLKEGGYEKVAFVGVCTDICVISNVLLYKAFAPNSEILVYRDSVAGVSEPTHENALLALACCHIDVV